MTASIQTEGYDQRTQVRLVCLALAAEHAASANNIVSLAEELEKFITRDEPPLTPAGKTTTITVNVRPELDTTLIVDQLESVATRLLDAARDIAPPNVCGWCKNEAVMFAAGGGGPTVAACDDHRTEFEDSEHRELDTDGCL